jgi:hypothetical protein
LPDKWPSKNTKKNGVEVPFSFHRARLCELKEYAERHISPEIIASRVGYDVSTVMQMLNRVNTLRRA